MNITNSMHDEAAVQRYKEFGKVCTNCERLKDYDAFDPECSGFSWNQCETCRKVAIKAVKDKVLRDKEHKDNVRKMKMTAIMSKTAGIFYIIMQLVSLGFLCYILYMVYPRAAMITYFNEPNFTDDEVHKVFKDLMIKANITNTHDMTLRIEDNDEFGAYASMRANGPIVVVTTGALEFFQSKEELAAVLGHEIAHHLLGHTTIEVEGGEARYWHSQLKENMADRVGTQLSFQAGYGKCGAKKVWGRLYHTRGDTYASSHPSIASRYLMGVELCEAR